MLALELESRQQKKMPAPENTPVRQLRGRLGLSQVRFADLIGRSHQSVAAYEKHPEDIPQEVIQRLGAIAEEHRYFDLAAQFGVTHPGETLISNVAQRPGVLPPPSYNPANKKWHDMLEDVLESGNEKARKAVIPNLEVFSDYVRTISRKRGMPKNRQIG
jgi:hypothetical protein